jgi:hypothetical protein
VARIIKGVRGEVHNLKPLMLKELDHHDRVVPILSQACAELNNLKVSPVEIFRKNAKFISLDVPAKNSALTAGDR